MKSPSLNWVDTSSASPVSASTRRSSCGSPYPVHQRSPGISFTGTRGDAAKAAGKYLHLIRQLNKSKVLVLDDFGLRSYTHEEATALVDLLDQHAQLLAGETGLRLHPLQLAGARRRPVATDLRGEVTCPGVAQRDGGILRAAGEEQPHRPPDRDAAAHDDNILAGDRNVIAPQQLDDATRRAGQRRLLAQDKPAEVGRVQAVGVLMTLQWRRAAKI